MASFICDPGPESYAKAIKPASTPVATRLVTPQTKLRAKITYDSLNEKYVATIDDYPDLTGFGSSWANAANDLEKVYWMYKAIIRLQNVLNKLESTNDR
jgi:hypothetical protein